MPDQQGQSLTFSVGRQLMSLPASIVREVTSMPRTTRVPHAPDALLGVANMRGNVIPVIAVDRLLGGDLAEKRRVVIVDANGLVGLAVSSVSQVTDGQGAQSAPRLDVAALIAKAMPALRQRRAESRVAVDAQDDGTNEGETVPLVAFLVSGQAFALPLPAVAEVIRLPDEIAAMPHADKAVIGSISRDGAVLPILSLAALLALPVRPATGRSRIIVVCIGHHRVGLVVDGIEAVVSVPEADIDPVPQVLNRGGAEARIHAICRMEGGGSLLSVLAPDQLLRDDITARLLQDDAGEQRGVTIVPVYDNDEQFLLFTIGDDSFGLPIEAVEEVVPLPPRLTPLPNAPAFVQGVMTVRGNLVPVIDQGSRFNDSPVTSARPRVVVVRTGQLVAGFIVDAVTGVARIAANDLRQTPDLGTDETRVFSKAAEVEGQGSLVLIISAEELLSRAEQELLDRLGKKGATSTT